MKAQGAVEYLIIFAVVVIIAIAIVSVLGGFPTIGAGVAAKQERAYWRTADIGFANYKQNAAATQAQIINNRDFTITVNTVGSQSVALTLLPGQQSAFTTINTATCAQVGTIWSVAATNLIINYTGGTTIYQFTPVDGISGTCASG